MLNSSQNLFDSQVQSASFVEKTTILPSPLIESNAKLNDELNGDQEKEWFERWDASHLVYSDVDLHF